MGAIVVMAASAGGLDPLLRIAAGLPLSLQAPVFVAMHIGCGPSLLPYLLARASGFPAVFAKDGAMIEAGRIYVAPPGHHMMVEKSRMRLSRGPKVHATCPAADPLFVSAAEAHGTRVIGVVLSGGGSDGAAGLRAIKEHGGLTLVQHPKDAVFPFMPRAAITAVHPDACLPAGEIARQVAQWTTRGGAARFPARHARATTHATLGRAASSAPV